MLKKLKIPFIILAVLLIIFFILSLLTAIFAKKIIIAQIENNLKVKADLKEVSLSLPLVINLTGLEIGSVFKAKKISVSLNPLGFLAGKIVISSLSLAEPVLNLEEAADGSLNLPLPQQKTGPPPIFLTGLHLRGGKVNFIDRKILPDGHRINIEKLNLDITKAILPLTSLNINFNLSADFAGTEANPLGSVAVSGWLDFTAKNMDAKVKIEGLELAQFFPYCGDFISNKKIDSAKLNLDSLLKAESNDLTVTTKLRLFNLVYSKSEEIPEAVPKLDLMKNALDLFTDKDGNLDLEFTVKTKLDKPMLDKKKIESAILKAAAKNLVNQPPEEVVNKVMNTVNQIKDFSKQLKEIFNK